MALSSNQLLVRLVNMAVRIRENTLPEQRWSLRYVDWFSYFLLPGDIVTHTHTRVLYNFKYFSKFSQHGHRKYVLFMSCWLLDPVCQTFGKQWDLVYSLINLSPLMYRFIRGTEISKSLFCSSVGRTCKKNLHCIQYIKSSPPPPVSTLKKVWNSVWSHALAFTVNTGNILTSLVPIV